VTAKGPLPYNYNFPKLVTFDTQTANISWLIYSHCLVALVRLRNKTCCRWVCKLLYNSQNLVNFGLQIAEITSRFLTGFLGVSHGMQDGHELATVRVAICLFCYY